MFTNEVIKGQGDRNDTTNKDSLNTDHLDHEGILLCQMAQSDSITIENPNQFSPEVMAKFFAKLKANPNDCIQIELIVMRKTRHSFDDGGFKIIGDILTATLPTNGNLKKLHLIFRRVEIDRSKIVSLLDHPNCPLGLSLVFRGCIDTEGRSPETRNSCHPLYGKDANYYKCIREALKKNTAVIGLEIYPPVTEDFWLNGCIDFKSETSDNRNYVRFLGLLWCVGNTKLEKELADFIKSPGNTDRIKNYFKDTDDKITLLYSFYKEFLCNLLAAKRIGDCLDWLWFFSAPLNFYFAHLIDLLGGLGNYLYTSCHIDYIDENDKGLGDEVTVADAQKFLDARNKIILWLMRHSDHRESCYSSMMGDCARQLLGIADAPGTNIAVVGCLELWRVINEIEITALPSEYYETNLPTPALAAKNFNYECLVEGGIRSKLIEVYGTDNVYVIEEIIGRSGDADIMSLSTTQLANLRNERREKKEKMPDFGKVNEEYMTQVLTTFKQYLPEPVQVEQLKSEPLSEDQSAAAAAAMPTRMRP